MTSRPRPRPHRCHRAAALLAGLLLAAPPSTASQSPACRRVSLEEPPQWVFSLAWNDTGTGILVADVLSQSLLVYSPAGELLARHRRPGEGELEVRRPVRIQPLDVGYLVADGAEHLVWLGPDHVPFRAVSLDTRDGSSGPQVRALFDLVEAGGRIHGFAHMEIAEGSWKQGFVRLGPDARTLDTVLAETPPGSREESFYHSLGPILTALGGKAFFLRFSEPPALFEASSPPRRLTAFPPGFERLPSLPTGGVEAQVARFQVLERSALPVAVYAWRDHLYLLTRRPEESGGTLWELHQIDPAADRLVRTLTLPTGASHLALTPGVDHWILLEKGPLVGPGEQDISSLLLLPASWIDEASSPLAGASPAPPCRSSAPRSQGVRP